MKQGHIFIISGPAGVGKTSTIKSLLERNPQFFFISSFTTRKARVEDAKLNNRIFITDEEFQEKIKNGELIEWEKVHDSYYVGKGKEEIEEALKDGKIIIIDIDVKGVKKYQESFPNVHLIFMQYRDLADFQHRITKSRPDCSQEELNMRYKTALKEMEHLSKYDHIVTTINDQSPEIPAKKIEEIINNILVNQPRNKI